MTNSPEVSLIAGESVDDLVRALLQLDWHVDDDGMWRCDARLEPDAGGPLVRAIMRIEAELLVNDANHVGSNEGHEERTPDQRRADALVALYLRVGGAMASRSG